MTPSKPGATKSRSRPGATKKKPASPKPEVLAPPAEGRPQKMNRAEEMESRALQQLGGLHLASASAPAAASQSGAVPGGRYVYGIIQAGEPLSSGRSGLAGSSEQIFTVPYQDNT